MADQFLGEIRLVGFNFAPVGWALCNGQIMAIGQNTALFSLLGTFYGGDGRSTFGLPNLQGMAAVNQGNGAGLSPYQIGQTGGAAQVTLATGNLPAHGHTLPVSTATGTANVSPGPSSFLAASAARGGTPLYATPAEQTAMPATMLSGAVGLAGGGGSHNNLPPYLVLNYIISLTGIFPSRA
jgi:microcystin-dependent protein